MHVLIVGGSRADRLRAASAWEHVRLVPAVLSNRSGSRVAAGASVRHVASLPVAEPRLVRVDDLETAFTFDPSSTLRLIVTQSTYTMQKWIDVLGAGDRMVATADRELLTQNAPEAFEKRGPWRLFQIIEVSATDDTEDTEPSVRIARRLSHRCPLCPRVLRGEALTSRRALAGSEGTLRRTASSR